MELKDYLLKEELNYTIYGTRAESEETVREKMNDDYWADDQEESRRRKSKVIFSWHKSGFMVLDN